MMRMPAEWEAHERTLIGFPCRESSWGKTFEQGRDEFATVANSIAAFEPVTVICATDQDLQDARSRLSASVETVVFPMDGSWLRDNGPIYVRDQSGKLLIQDWGFNGWGQKAAWQR